MRAILSIIGVLVGIFTALFLTDRSIRAANKLKRDYITIERETRLY